MLLRLGIAGQALEDRRGLGREYDSEFLYVPGGVDGKDNKFLQWLDAFSSELEDVVAPMLELTRAAANGKTQNQISVFFRNIDLAKAGIGSRSNLASKV